MAQKVEDLTCMEDALCRKQQVDSSVFFPEKHDPETRIKMVEARRICGECSVMEQCREYAINYERLGFWGGLTERQRAAVRRDRELKLGKRYLD